MEKKKQRNTVPEKSIRPRRFFHPAVSIVFFFIFLSADPALTQQAQPSPVRQEPQIEQASPSAGGETEQQKSAQAAPPPGQTLKEQAQQVAPPARREEQTQLRQAPPAEQPRAEQEPRVLQTQQTRKQGEPEQPKPPRVKMTLHDCVILALMNNLDVKGAYLDRIINRFTLQQAEQRFWLPTDPYLKLSAASNSTYGDTGRTQSLRPGGMFVSQLGLPTGARIDVTWDNSAYRQDIGVAYAYTSGWSATFTQPLLKGGGIDNATYAVKTARIAEEKNILSLRDTVSTTIGQAIANFRTYASAIKTLENSEKALENARQTYEINKAMVAAGRMARTELVQSEADIAGREYDLISARNGLDSARLTLLSFLNIDKNLVFDPVDEKEIRLSPPPLEEALEIAFKNRTDYLSALYDQEVRKLTLKTATRNRMWALDFKALTEAGKTGDGETFAGAFGNQNISKRNWALNLDLTIPLTWLTEDRKAYLIAKNEVEKGEWSLKKKRSDIEIEMQNAIREVEMKYKALELAREARKLSEQKLDIENVKLKLGRTTNFQLVSFQNDLKSRQDAELLAITAYLGAIDTLDSKLGVTLNRWGITIRKEDDVIRLNETDKREADQKLLELNLAPGGAERKVP